jgi:hypothetical protein
MIKDGESYFPCMKTRETLPKNLNSELYILYNSHCTLYQERAVFGKMKMDPAKRAQTQNAGEV